MRLRTISSHGEEEEEEEDLGDKEAATRLAAFVSTPDEATDCSDVNPVVGRTPVADSPASGGAMSAPSSQKGCCVVS